jgi:hypothetical protein
MEAKIMRENRVFRLTAPAAGGMVKIPQNLSGLTALDSSAAFFMP